MDAFSVAVGGRMIFDGLKSDGTGFNRSDPTHAWSLVVLSIATSIDALTIGLSFAALGVEVWIPAAVIGLTACAMTLVGTLGGRALGRGFGTRMAVVGGVVLIAIGASPHFSPGVYYGRRIAASRCACLKSCSST